MRRQFTASISQEENWHVAQCLEIDVASQGKTEQEALRNLAEALELHLEPPHATILPTLKQIEIEIGAA